MYIVYNGYSLRTHILSFQYTQHTAEETVSSSAVKLMSTMFLYKEKTPAITEVHFTSITTNKGLNISSPTQ